MNAVKKILLLLLLLGSRPMQAQLLSLDTLLNLIETGHPELQMFDQQIAAYTSAAEGARNWEMPQLGAGFFMTPYKLQMWKAQQGQGGEMRPGMGSFMLSAQQMLPNRQRQRSEAQYMRSMAEVETENKQALLNRMRAEAKNNYYSWAILRKKISLLKELEELMRFMLQSAELRYTYNREKLANIYKARAELAAMQAMIPMLEAEISMKNIMLNTLLSRPADAVFDIDSSLYDKKIFVLRLPDAAAIENERSDIRSINRQINRIRLRQAAEKSMTRPELGIRYDHMMAFGRQPAQFSLMTMLKIPAPWALRQYKAGIRAANFEIQALEKQKQAAINEISGRLYALTAEIRGLQQQIDIYQKNVIPALSHSYQSSLLAYEQNNEELLMVLDAWRSLKNTRLELLDKIQRLLNLEVEYEKELEKK